MPIEYVTGWLFQVARNRITDLFRKKKPENFSDAAVADENGELLRIEDLLPSADAGPEAAYLRNEMLEELELALAELPEEQRSVFMAHEIQGRSFKELSRETRRKHQHAAIAQAVRSTASAGATAEHSRRVFREMRKSI